MPPLGEWEAPWTWMDYHEPHHDEQAKPLSKGRKPQRIVLWNFLVLLNVHNSNLKLDSEIVWIISCCGVVRGKTSVRHKCTIVRRYAWIRIDVTAEWCLLVATMQDVLRRDVEGFMDTKLRRCDHMSSWCVKKGA
jgi:hypothetical protein